MNPSTLRRGVLSIFVTLGVLYLFGIRSGLIVIALPVISIGVLYFGMTGVLGDVLAADAMLGASERVFGYVNARLRVYTDTSGQIWLRAGDLKTLLEHGKSDAWLAQHHPAHYRKVHPAIDTYYMHPAIVQDVAGKRRSGSVQRFLDWLEREVIGMHRFERSMAAAGNATATAQPSTRTRPPKTAVRRNWVLAYFGRHWRGETGLMAAISLGGVSLPSPTWPFTWWRCRWTSRAITGS